MQEQVPEPRRPQHQHEQQHEQLEKQRQPLEQRCNLEMLAKALNNQPLGELLAAGHYSFS